jgi:hypothetical protein
MTQLPQGRNTSLQPPEGDSHSAPVFLFGDIHAINRALLQPGIRIGKVTENPCRALDLIQANALRRVLFHESFEEFDSCVPFRVLVHLPRSPTESGYLVGTHGLHNIPIVFANQPVQREFALVLRVERNPAKKKAVKGDPQSPDINRFRDLPPRR